MRSEEVLRRVKVEMSILHTVTRRKANWIGHILGSNCHLKQVMEGKIKGSMEVTGRLGRGLKQLLDDFKQKRGYWKLKEKALCCTMWRTGFGKSYGPVAKQEIE
jgi:hypothetical protein